MAGEIEAKLKAERMFAEAQAKALGGPYANISKEYVNKYMDSSSLSKALAERVSTNYSLGYLSGWAGIPGDMLNALTSWAVSGIPDQRLRQQAKRSLTVAGTEEIGEAMGADVESEAFQWGTVGLPGLEDLVKKSPYLSMVLFHGTKDPRKIIPKGGMTDNIKDIFDMRFVGDASKGEGATAFGWGLYFSQKPGVAGSYKPNSRTISNEAKDALDKLDWLGFDSRGEAVAAIRSERRRGNDWPSLWDVDADKNEDLIRVLNNEADESFGAMLEVDIPDEVVGEMLDWNKPLSEQPDNVKQAISKLFDERGHQVAGAMDSTGAHSYKSLSAAEDGAELYNRLEEIFRQENVSNYSQKASTTLQELGIPGIRYNAGMLSNKVDAVERNLVLFDPEYIKNVKRDGELIYDKNQILLDMDMLP